MKYLLIGLVVLILGISGFFFLKPNLNNDSKREGIVNDWIYSKYTNKDGDLIDISKYNFEISFTKDGLVVGKICNSFSGKYSLSGKTIIVTELTSTEMYCEQMAEAESTFIHSLNQPYRIVLNDGGLKIYTSEIDYVELYRL